MNKAYLCVIAIAMCAACHSANGESGGQSKDVDTVAEWDEACEVVINEPKADVPQGAQAIIDAFPGIVSGYGDNSLLMADGSAIVYDDGKKKDFAMMLDNCDIEDMFFVPYTVPDGAPEYLADAGRGRNEELYKKIYGESQAAVSRNLVPVEWFGQSVRFTKVNGAADSLRKVKAELAKIPELKKYLKCSGTYYWRQVRGAKRLSAHSYGIAIDIGTDYSDYWLWRNAGASETAKIKYSNRIPRQIVEIFQMHGFIWGGAWYHFDTMHFEFRPEILRYAQLHQQSK